MSARGRTVQVARATDQLEPGPGAELGVAVREVGFNRPRADKQQAANFRGGPALAS